MNCRSGLCLALGLFSITAARAAQVRPGVPALLDPNPAVSCIVPATFPVNGAPARALFLATGMGVAVKWDGQPEQLLWPRALLKGGEQRPSGVYLATNFGTLCSANGMYVRFCSPLIFTLVSPFGWVRDLDGLWNLTDSGAFARSGLPIAPWRNVTGFAPSTNYLYGPNLLWVGSAAYFNYQRGFYQAVNVGGRSLPTYGLPDYLDCTGVCGITHGYVIVYDGRVMQHLDSTNPNAVEYTDSGLTPDNYALQSLRYGPNDVDAVAYVGRTLWLNLGSSAPTSLFMPGAVHYVANDADRHQLVVSTSAGVFAVPYTLG